MFTHSVFVKINSDAILLETRGMSTVEQHLYTPEDLLEMPDGDRYELVDGQLVERADKGAYAVWVVGQISSRLSQFEDKNGGRAFGTSVGYVCFPFDPNRVRVPDASYIRRGGLKNDEIPEGHIRIVPDLVVEVVAPTDLYCNVENKVEEYLRSGVKMVWLVNAKLQTLRVFRENIFNMKQVGPDDELTGDDILPGFSCPVAELFPTPKESTHREQPEQ